MNIRVARDGMKNVVVMIYGEIEESLEQTVVIDPASLNHECSQIKLDQVQYSIEGGVKVRVGWSEDGMFCHLKAVVC